MDPKQIASTLRQYALEKSQIENALALRAMLQQILASVRLVKINTESHECPAVTTTVVIGCNLAVSKS